MRKFLALVFLFNSILLSGQPLKVMTYNIRYDNPADGVNEWSKRKEKVFTLLKKYDPDIFGVQEALYHQLEAINKSLPGYSYVGGGRNDGKKSGEYSAIFF